MALRDFFTNRQAGSVARVMESYAATDDPRKIPTGTSFDAKGSLVPTADVLVEKGSSRAIAVFEGLPELRQQRQRLAAYDRMLNDDSTVDVTIRAIKSAVLGAHFYTEPYSERDDDKEIAEFVEYNLFDGMNTPFTMIIEEALRMCEYGISALEPVYEHREWVPKRANANTRNFTMLRKLAPRPVHNISEFKYDDEGGPNGVVYQAVRADGDVDEVEIPIEKLILFTLNKRGGNLEGKSLLRTAYKHWWYKDLLYKIDGIQKERHAVGVPEVELMPGFNQEDSNAAWQLVRNLRANESAGIVKPPGMLVGFAKIEGQLVDVLKSIEHHDARIALNVMTQFLLLGLTGTGGARATAGAHQDMFLKSLKYLAGYICDHFNLYLIPRLVAYNYATRNFPKLKVRNLGETAELQRWASGIANLIARGAVIPDPEFRHWVRQILGAPNEMEGAQQVVPQNPRKGDVSPNNDRGGNKPAPTDAA